MAAGLVGALELEVPEAIETARLELRATRAGHAQVVHAAAQESLEQLRHWMPWARSGLSEEAAATHCRESELKWHAREILDFCFFERIGGEFVGKGGLHTIEWDVPKFEIGYWVRTPRASRGYATEACIGMAAFARAILGARRIEITADARNAASRRVAEKAGFTLEGVMRNRRRDAAGRLADACMYAMVFPDPVAP
jgi:RimJ/RimL family protein N-acetyltransferase